MTIQECYERLGGNYAQAEARLLNANLIKKFITKFLDDGSYAELCRAMEAGQREEAFRAAHTLKGVCANLSFDRLFGSASQLTELLRGTADSLPEDAHRLFEAVRQDYDQTADVIRAYLEQDGSVQ